MCEIQFQCWICPKCFDDHQPGQECTTHSEDSEHRADAPKGCPVQAGCSPRSGSDDRAELAAKRPIPPRVAGRNPAVDRRPTGKGEKQ